MKRKLFSLALAVSMACTLAAPAAAAAPTAEDRLAAVTARVKQILDLDTGVYTNFSGNLNEDLLAPGWSLEWSRDGKQLSVSAAETGKILSYRLYEEDQGAASSGWRTAPTFPAGSWDEARSAARRFLDKVLTEGESATLTAVSSGQLNTSVYRFRGKILRNGLSAGMTFSISVRCADYEIMSFYRDDLNGQVMGDVPDHTPAVTRTDAAKVLRQTLRLRLEYQLAESGGSQAVLRYVPEYGDRWYVDALTGELVNLSELARDAERGGGAVTNADAGAMKEEASMDSAASPAMAVPTPAEQEGTAKLKDVLDKDALDKKARAVTALGLKNYTLSTVNYAVAQKEDDPVTATLRYGRQVNGVSWRRTVVLDAKTGALIRVYSSGWMPEGPAASPVSVSAAQSKAEAFLKAQCGAQFAKTELRDTFDAGSAERSVFHSFTFVRKENGCFFPENAIVIGVDATDGSISAYEKTFDDAVTFDSPEGVLTADQAVDAWLATYEAALQYVRVPAAVDYSKPEYEPLKGVGVRYLYRLVLGYMLERETNFPSLDAKTGQPVEYERASSDGEMTYDDLEGCWAREQIETLALYQVGYAGGSFRPDKALTQLDLTALLASTQGYRWDPSSDETADRLYEYACGMGILRREDRNDGLVLTRMDAIRMILDATGYGEIAGLQGIYRVKFTDSAAIPASELGYAALAQGLGMASGDSRGRLLPNRTATRAQAAVLLYNLMSR